MSLDGKPLESINEGDLQELVDNKVLEVKTLEYKLSLPEEQRKKRREFLFDVSSFANASGGHLIYGVRQDNETGEPVEVCGLDTINADAEILRLENMIRDGVKPRIPGIQIHPVPLKSSGHAIVIRIPKSFRLPHMVIFTDSRKFYSRNSAGKYALDVDELRTAFLLSDTTAKRIRDFRAGRLCMIAAGETPVVMNKDAKIVLHIVPFRAFDPAMRFNVSSLVHKTGSLEPIYAANWNPRHNFDGFLTYTDCGPLGHTSYVQIFHNGSIEAVEAYLLHNKKEGTGLIPSDCFEQKLIEAVKRYLLIQKQLGVEPPIFIMLSLLGVSGYIMHVSPFQFRLGNVNPIDRDILLVPEIMLESLDCDVAEVMRPAFDAVWNASGFPRSMNYDDNGKWKGH